MNKFIFLTVMILIFSCKESTNSRNKVLDNRMKDGVSKVDYHKIMDVVLDTFKIQHDKIIYIEYKPSKKAIDTSRRNFILNNSNLSKDEKK